MPQVDLELDIRAAADRVWDAIVDVERYPVSMRSVRWVRVLERPSADVQRSAWSIDLKGSILEWREEDHYDREGLTVRFHQLSGDLELFDGTWVLTRLEPELTRVTFSVSFEIGIPLLADMLNPVARRSLHENCTEMLQGVEREALTV